MKDSLSKKIIFLLCFCCANLMGLLTTLAVFLFFVQVVIPQEPFYLLKAKTSFIWERDSLEKDFIKNFNPKDLSREIGQVKRQLLVEISMEKEKFFSKQRRLKKAKKIIAKDKIVLPDLSLPPQNYSLNIDIPKNDFSLVSLLKDQKNFEDEEIIEDTLSFRDSGIEKEKSFDLDDSSWKALESFIDQEEKKVSYMKKEISPSLKETVQRIEKEQFAPIVKNNEISKNDLIAMIDETFPGPDVSQLKKNSPLLTPFLENSNAFLEDEQSFQSKNFLTSLEINKNSLVRGKVFDFIGEGDLENIHIANKRGVVEISYNLSPHLFQSFLRGTLHNKDMMLTLVDIPLSGANSFELEVPVFGLAYFSELCSKNDLSTRGSFLLVKLPQVGATADLLANYAKTILFNENFEEISDEKLAQYVLFLSVDSGNTLFKVRTLSGKVAEKIIHLEDGSVLYEDIEIRDEYTREIELWADSVFGSIPFELSLDEAQIRASNADKNARAIGINRYEVVIPPLLDTSREYLHLDYANQKFLVGLWKTPKIILPSENFLENLFEFLEVDSLDNRCLLQLNLPKEAKDFLVDFKGSSGPDFFRNFFLDKTGQFSEEISPETKKIFILSERPGIFSFKVFYYTGEIDYFSSHCLEGAYLLEQF